MEESGIDPYVFQRNSYFQYREDKIYDGNPPNREIDIGPATEEDLELEKALELELEKDLEKELQLDKP